ncbi:glycine cleavage system aminomethyltransferase GcvT [Longimicrobium sp.]|uniref:glycine cleavage system aminomethyltransferase GcvT n=1 Tax=Longimicrobium sp. TaxID=2029185 RepID=UPI002C3CC04A|nr:glycine cleavage system aminomethyltransferase GcvT [Longimicrobium sp.]HSU15334.1 glycine cleavage system aminomethyltransferase GcvT [Longimicrobium sp.]
MADATQTLQRTPLHAEHLRLNAKMVPFAGYEMPVQYPSGITAEHNAVRSAAGLFDVSHMGEFEVRGRRALDFVQHITTNDASRLAVGQAQYSTMVNEQGMVIDDLLVYRFPGHYMLVVNGANRHKDWDWARRWAAEIGAELEDRTDDIALLALQGPKAPEILARLTETDLDAIRYYHFEEGLVDRVPAIISRTGYTGEDGFELYVPAAQAAALWRKLLETGAADGLIATGLGSRDSLRLEMGMALYGNDLDDGHTPLEGGLGWVTKLDKGDFVGREALARQKEAGVKRRLVGFRLKERGFPRPHYTVTFNGQTVGEVTSGTLSPTLGEGIGMAYVPPEAAKPGTEIGIVIRDRAVPAEVVKPPFHTKGTVKR